MKIRVGIVYNEVDLFDLRNRNSHLGGYESPQIDKLDKVFIVPHLFNDQIYEARDITDSVGVLREESSSHSRKILYILDREGVIPFECVPF